MFSQFFFNLWFTFKVFIEPYFNKLTRNKWADPFFEDVYRLYFDRAIKQFVAELKEQYPCVDQTDKKEHNFIDYHVKQSVLICAMDNTGMSKTPVFTRLGHRALLNNIFEINRIAVSVYIKLINDEFFGHTFQIAHMTGPVDVAYGLQMVRNEEDKVSLEVKSKTIEAKAWRSQCKVTAEMKQDMRLMYNVDYVPIVAEELYSEIKAWCYESMLTHNIDCAGKSGDQIRCEIIAYCNKHMAACRNFVDGNALICSNPFVMSYVASKSFEINKRTQCMNNFNSDDSYIYIKHGGENRLKSSLLWLPYTFALYQIKETKVVDHISWCPYSKYMVRAAVAPMFHPFPRFKLVNLGLDTVLNNIVPKTETAELIDEKVTVQVGSLLFEK